MVKWTAEADQKLLLCIVANFKLDVKAIIDTWKKKYGDKEDPPTVRAIEQHIDKLKKNNPSKAGDAATASTPRKAPATPKKMAVPKTPTSSAKRKRSTMSEEENDDGEPNMSKARLSQDQGRRVSLPRSNKGANKRYEENSDDEDGDDEAEAGPIKVEKGEDGDHNIFEGMINFDGIAEPKPKPKPTPFYLDNGFHSSNYRTLLPSTGTTLKTNSPNKKRFRNADLADESDVSNFSDGMIVE